MTELNIPSHSIAMPKAQVDEILRGVRVALTEGKVVLGPKTEEFEAKFAEACGRKYGVAVGSDTAAFEMQLRMTGCEGQPVLFPALGFSSILQAVVNAGARPYFVDADLEANLFASAEMIEDAILSCLTDEGVYPRALILMHTGGLLARDSAEIAKICMNYGVEVLEDAAHAFGATLNGAPAGSYGLSSAFSLYATKPMHALEGGMIVTDSSAVAEEAMAYRNYGRVSDFGRSICTVHGNSWRMTEVQAIVGLSNLRRMKKNLADRREIMATYDLMTDSPWWDEHAPRLQVSESCEPNGYRYIRMLPDWADAEYRGQMKKELKEQYYIDLPGEVYELPAHKQPIWREYERCRMPVAEDFCSRHFALPCYPGLTSDDQDFIVGAVEQVLRSVA